MEQNLFGRAYFCILFKCIVEKELSIINNKRYLDFMNAFDFPSSRINI